MYKERPYLHAWVVLLDCHLRGRMHQNLKWTQINHDI